MLNSRLRVHLRYIPFVGLLGLYFLIQAQRRWNHEPYFSTKTSFTYMLIGTTLVVLQGWHSLRRDWQPLIEFDARRHLFFGRKGLLSVGVLILGVGLTWQNIVTSKLLSPQTFIGWMGAIVLVVVIQVPKSHWLAGGIRAKLLAHRDKFLPTIQWTIALIGISYCLYVGWRADLRQTHAVQLIRMWWVGIGLTLVGLVPMPTLKAWLSRLWQSFRKDDAEWLVVFSLSVLAMVVRVAWLETSPYIQAEDEAAFAIEAIDLVGFSRWIDNPFRFGVWHHPLIYQMLQVGSIQALGQTIFAARLPSAVLGALTVPSVYLMGRRMFNWRVGLVAAIWMVTFPVHVHFSRISINQVGDPLFATLAFAFLTQAMRTADEMEYALAGISIGLSQYFYSASRIVPLLMVVYVLLYAVANRQWIWRRGDLVLVAVLMAFVVAFPVYYSVYQDKERPLNPRLQQVAIFETGDVEAALAENRWEAYWKYQFQHSYGAYVQRVDQSGFYGRYHGLAGWYGAAFFLLGIALSLRRYYDPRWLILVIWVILTGLLGGVLLVDPPHFPRFVSVMPAMSILIGLGVVYIVEIIQDTPQRIGSQYAPYWDYVWFRTVILLAFISVLAVMNILDYTQGYLPKRLVYGERTVNLNVTARFIKSIDDLNEREMYFLSSNEMNLIGSNLTRYQTGKRGKEYLLDRRDIRQFPAGDYIFVASSARYTDLQQIIVLFPLSELYPVVSDYDNQTVAYVLLLTKHE